VLGRGERVCRAVALSVDVGGQVRDTTTSARSVGGGGVKKRCRSEFRLQWANGVVGEGKFICEWGRSVQMKMNSAAHNGYCGLVEEMVHVIWVRGA